MPQQPRNADRSVFDFGLNVRRGNRADIVVVRFTLPSSFPQIAPQATVLTEGVKHAWIDPRGNITGCPALYSWNSYNSRLYQAVTDVINEFVSHPPQIRESSGAYSRPPAVKPRPQPAKVVEESHIVLPPTPDAFPELDALSVEELRKLQDDSSAFQDLFDSLTITRTIVEMRDEIKASNKKQARANMQQKSRIEELQSEVLLKQEHVLAEWNDMKILEERQNVAMRQFDPLRLLMNLESSCNKLEDESEDVASEFLNGDIEYAEFIKRETELRKLYHLRKAKAERFRYQLKQVS